MMKIKLLLPLLTLIALANTAFGQKDTLNSEPITIGGGLDISFQTPKSYEIGSIRVEGADNFDPQAIKLIAGLRQGSTITIPGDAVSKAIRNLYAEELFSHVEILAEKETAGVIYLTIKVAPRPKLSRFKFGWSKET